MDHLATLADSNIKLSEARVSPNVRHVISVHAAAQRPAQLETCARVGAWHSWKHSLQRALTFQLSCKASTVSTSYGELLSTLLNAALQAIKQTVAAGGQGCMQFCTNESLQPCKRMLYILAWSDQGPQGRPLVTGLGAMGTRLLKLNITKAASSNHT